MTPINRVARQDWRFVPPEPDPDFDPEHNRKVVEKTIADSERANRISQRGYKDELEERANASVMYLKSVERGGANSSVDTYFGKSHIARLRAESIKDKLGKLRILAPNGQLMKKI